VGSSGERSNQLIGNRFLDYSDRERRNMTAFRFNRTQVPESHLVRAQEDYDSYSRHHYERRHSLDAAVFKAQFIELDKRLLDLFSYVAPAEANKATYSVTLATIIRNAASLFELGSRWLLPQAFDCVDRELNIFHYLYLDKITQASSIILRSFQFYDQFSSAQVYQPFVVLENWDQSSLPDSAHVPVWWTASNKLKHTNSGLRDYGTLENAIAAVGACFAFLHAVFGPGMVYGVDVDEGGVLHNEITSSIFFL
jgi:hypothetical protein